MGDETQKTINFGSKLSFILSFLFLERLHCCYIALNCTTTIISLEPCALNAGYEHFILRFIKTSFYFANTIERGDRGWKEEAQRQGEHRVTLQINLICKTKIPLLFINEVPPQFNFSFCNEPIWLAHDSKINKKLWEISKLEGSFLKYTIPPPLAQLYSWKEDNICQSIWG
jgi:hypothetical protein